LNENVGLSGCENTKVQSSSACFSLRQEEVLREAEGRQALLLQPSAAAQTVSSLMYIFPAT
jgi:hypothetical protein